MLNKINLWINYFCEWNIINEEETKDNEIINSNIKTFYWKLLDCLINKKKDENIFNVNSSFNFMLYKYESSNINWIKKFNLQKNYEKIKSYLIFIKMILENKLYDNKYFLKREIFYNFINYFENQNELDKRIKELSYYCKLKRSDLNIYSSAKGLVYGSLIIEIDNNQISLNNPIFKDGFLINFYDFKIIDSKINNIIIVEKETIFYNLIQYNIKDKLPDTLIITGKGYADYKTKYFIKKLVEMLRLPIFYLGDFDPFGYDIYLNYLFNSKYTIYESLELQYIIHLGIKSFDIPENLLKNFKNINLNNYDISKLNKLLKKSYFNEIKFINKNEIDFFFLEEINKIKKDLLFMLNNNLKFEFEIWNTLKINYLDYIIQKFTIIYNF